MSKVDHALKLYNQYMKYLSESFVCLAMMDKEPNEKAKYKNQGNDALQKAEEARLEMETLLATDLKVEIDDRIRKNDKRIQEQKAEREALLPAYKCARWGSLVGTLGMILSFGVMPLSGLGVIGFALNTLGGMFGDVWTEEEKAVYIPESVRILAICFGVLLATVLIVVICRKFSASCELKIDAVKRIESKIDELEEECKALRFLWNSCK